MTRWISNIKNQLFKKIITFYSLIAIIFLTCLSCLSIYIINDNKTKEIKNANSRLIDETYYTLTSKYNTSQNILNNLYVNKSYADSVLTFLEIGYPDFYTYSLNSYFKNNISHFARLNAYLEISLLQDRDIDSIILYSIKSEFLYTFNGETESKYYNNDTELFKSYKEELSKYPLTEKAIFKTNCPTDSSTSSTYSYILTIQNPISLRPVGKIIINYDSKSIHNSIFNNSNSINPGHVKILTNNNNVVFDSANEYNQNIDPDIIRYSNHNYRLVDSTYVKSIKNTDADIVILGVIPKKIIQNYVKPTILLILLVTILCIIAIIGLSILFTASYSSRLHNITSAIKKVRNGDLSVRIKTKNKKDELTAISNNFNKMCDDLNDYIEKVYVYQVKQKSAELKSLQAQINPHFLYNTLESIRMRAAVSGAKDVSEMIYILATFFRNSLKTETITTIEKELEHCQLYLKLFQIRYNNKLTVNLNVEESMLSYSIVKLSLQPIVENYIVHGINLDATNNSITINSYFKDKDIYIEIEDNGCGIEESTLNNIKLALEHKVQPTSIGIYNVHERLRIVYGDSYGLKISSQKNVGTKVTIHIPAKKKGDL
ncbi:sensor histidine kinase [Vallitalea guaymasensis]|uniref:sensor histidine kinase n=1 Tax=Vallitalea guaymasensis TaxID=1185412 RepID=UPI002352703B|nr:sensor histidine kinase [Vallitalea guaymasensis]